MIRCYCGGAGVHSHWLIWYPLICSCNLSVVRLWVIWIPPPSFYLLFTFSQWDIMPFSLFLFSIKTNIFLLFILLPRTIHYIGIFLKKFSLCSFVYVVNFALWQNLLYYISDCFTLRVIFLQSFKSICESSAIWQCHSSPAKACWGDF